MRHLLTSLYGRVVLGIAIGVAIGVLAPGSAVELKLLADVFIALVTMTIAPLVFCTVVTGIAHMTSLRAVGKVGGLAIVYFEVASTLALFIGLTIVDVVGPGRGMAATVTAAGAARVEAAKTGPGGGSFVLDLIPSSVVTTWCGCWWSRSCSASRCTAFASAARRCSS